MSELLKMVGETTSDDLFVDLYPLPPLRAHHAPEECSLLSSKPLYPVR